jgi:hypothetical protein
MLLLFLMGFHIWNDFLGVTSIFGMTISGLQLHPSPSASLADWPLMTLMSSCIPLRVRASRSSDW